MKSLLVLIALSISFTANAALNPTITEMMRDDPLCKSLHVEKFTAGFGQCKVRFNDGSWNAITWEYSKKKNKFYFAAGMYPNKKGQFTNAATIAKSLVQFMAKFDDSINQEKVYNQFVALPVGGLNDKTFSINGFKIEVPAKSYVESRQRYYIDASIVVK